jgi:hypothetical protein
MVSKVSKDTISSHQERHAQLIGRAVSQFQNLLKQAEQSGSYGTVGVEVDVRQGLAHVVRMKSTTTET